MLRGCGGITIREAAHHLGKSEATVRRLVRSGKLPAHIENLDPWGPTWVINENDLVRLTHPNQPMIEIIPPDDAPPQQMLRDVREGLLTLTKVIREGNQGIRHELYVQKESMESEIQSLRQEVEQLRSELAERQNRSWWPWKR